MTGMLGQAIALTIVGNDVLRGHPSPDFWPAASVFQYCAKVTFATIGPATEQLYADDPSDWFTKLAHAKIRGLRLRYVSRGDPRLEAALAAFLGGGPRWLIESVRDGAVEIWEPRWQTTEGPSVGNRIWEVRYVRLGVSIEALPFRAQGLSALHVDLADVLRRVAAFADRHQLTDFARSFRRAIGCLDSETPCAGLYYPEWDRVATLPLAAKQLLGASQAGDLFGGMGSWNDLGFPEPDQAGYLALSRELSALLRQVNCEAASAGFAQAA